MRKLDDKIIEFFQNIYLWVFDRTGIYVGTVMFLLMALSVVLEGCKTYQIVFLAIFGVLAGIKYHMQDKKLLTVFNAMADAERDYRLMRAVGVSFTLFNVTCSLLNQDMWIAAGESLFIGWWYTLPIKIRDREPPEKKFWQLARQGA